MTNLIEASMKGSSKPAIARRAFTAHSASEASAVLEHEQGSSNPQAETERCGDEDRETRTKASELRLDFDRGSERGRCNLRFVFASEPRTFETRRRRTPPSGYMPGSLAGKKDGPLL